MSDSSAPSARLPNFTIASAVARAPAAIQTQLGQSAARLSNLGLSVSQAGPRLTALLSGTPPTTLKASLGAVLRGGDEQAGQIIGQLGLANNTPAAQASRQLGAALEDRLASLDAKAQEKFTQLFHYSGGEAVFSRKSEADRLVVRATLAAAFAQGTDLDTVVALRKVIDHCSSETRNAVYSAVVGQEVSPTALTAALTGTAEVGAKDVGSVYTALEAAYGTRAAPKELEKYDGAVQLFRESLKKPADNPLGIPAAILGNLTASQKQGYSEGMRAVSFYCAEGHIDMNAALRNASGDSSKLPPTEAATIRLATEALRILPDYRGIVCRGCDSNRGNMPQALLSDYVVGKVVTEVAFTSSSCDKGYDDKDVQFIIESHHGKNVSPLSSEQKTDGTEILFEPATRFEVLDRAEAIDPSTGQKKIFIVMREMPRG